MHDDDLHPIAKGRARNFRRRRNNVSKTNEQRDHSRDRKAKAQTNYLNG